MPSSLNRTEPPARFAVDTSGETHDLAGAVRPTGAHLTARVEEQHDRHGDLVYALTIAGTTYDRRALDRVAEVLGCELAFRPVGGAA